ncbi:MAG: hypothetical protein ACI8Q1_003166 [Parvicella sp.]|jgi:hypothetical protein
MNEAAPIDIEYKPDFEWPSWMEAISFVAIIVGIFYAKYGIEIDDPELSYLNWMPGMYSIVSFLNAALFAVVWWALLVVMLMSMVMWQTVVPFIPLAVIVGLLGFANSDEGVRKASQIVGLAKVECWYPDTRECIEGKLRKANELKTTTHLQSNELSLLGEYESLWTDSRKNSSESIEEYRARQGDYWNDMKSLLSSYPSFKKRS